MKRLGTLRMRNGKWNIHRWIPGACREFSINFSDLTLTSDYFRTFRGRRWGDLFGNRLRGGGWMELGMLGIRGPMRCAREYNEMTGLLVLPPSSIFVFTGRSVVGD